MDVNEFTINFKLWLRDNQLDDNANFKWWNVDTSIFSMLTVIKRIKTSKINFVKMTGQDFRGIGNKIYVAYIGKEFSFSTIHQHFRIGIIFGAIEFNEEFSHYKTVKDFIVDWSNKKLELKINPKFLKADNYIDYLFDNLEEIKANFIEIDKKCKNFIRNDLYNLLFDLFLFHNVEQGKIDEKGCKVLKIVDKFKMKANSDLNSWNLAYSTNRPIKGFSQLLFDEKELTVSKRDKNKNALIGEIGEHLFDIFSRNVYNKKQENLHLFKKINHEKVRLLPFKTVRWESKNNQYSRYDFEIDENFFEIKSTAKNDPKNSFIISDNEWKHMDQFRDYSYVCLMKNININEVLFNEKDDLKLLNKIRMDFLDFDQIKNDYSFTNRGYWVKQK